MVHLKLRYKHKNIKHKLFINRRSKSDKFQDYIQQQCIERSVSYDLLEDQHQSLEWSRIYSFARVVVRDMDTYQGRLAKPATP